MLGSAVESLLIESKKPFIASDKEVDITNLNTVKNYAQQNFSDNTLNYIINCAAYTAVDKAEDQPEAAEKLNHTGPKNLAVIAKQLKATLIHVSTDYVFDGKNADGYYENDAPNPVSVYGRTKKDGEEAIQSSGAAYYIVRTAWLFGENGPNFVATMLSLFQASKPVKVVNDQWGSPTYAGDLAKALFRFTETDLAENSAGKNPPPKGIYHFTNSGVTSWYDFAREIFTQSVERGLCPQNSTIDPVPSTEYPTKAHRPHYSFLHRDKIIKAFNIEIRDYKHALTTYLSSIKKSINDKNANFKNTGEKANGNN